MTYTEDYLRKLTPGKWYQIKDIPDVIGMGGLCEAIARQILMPEFEIKLGFYCATFKVIRVEIEAMRIINRITA